MLKRLVYGILLTLLLTDMLMLTFSIQLVKSEPKTWIVDDDGPADFHLAQHGLLYISQGLLQYLLAENGFP
jgi:hypothetical protein